MMIGKQFRRKTPSGRWIPYRGQYKISTSRRIVYSAPLAIFMAFGWAVFFGIFQKHGMDASGIFLLVFLLFATAELFGLWDRKRK